MIQFTHNNHLKFGWGDGLYNFNNKDQQVWMEFGRAEYIPTSFKDECLRAARLIGEAADKPILVLLSGGVDSEVTARCFLEAGVPFEVVTANIIYNGKIVNDNDTKYTTAFIEKFNLTAHSIDIDLIDDIVNRSKEISATNDPSEPYYRVSLVFLNILTVCEKFCENYYCVTGAGNVVMDTYRTHRQTAQKQARDIKYGLYVKNACTVSAASTYEVAYRQSVNLTRFFCYTPELFLAWVLEPDVQHWIKYEKALMGPHGWMNSNVAKSFVLYKIWPDMEVRPKLSGWENMQEFLELNDSYYDDTSFVKIPIDDFLDMLLPKENN